MLEDDAFTFSSPVPVTKAYDVTLQHEEVVTVSKDFFGEKVKIECTDVKKIIKEMIKMIEKQ